MIDNTDRDAETRALLVPAMGRFVLDLGVMAVARFGALSLAGWTEADHSAAKLWAERERLFITGPPPPKIARYLRELRQGAGHGALGFEHPDLAPVRVAAEWDIRPPADQRAGVTLERLVWGAVHNAGRTGHRRPRWAAVKEAFGVGSTTATEVCRAYHLDPDEEVGIEDEGDPDE